MPTRNVNLTAEQNAFLNEAVRTGKYQNASEAIRDAVRSWQQRLEADELKLSVLRASVQAGLDALERGEFSDIDDSELDAALDALAPSPAA